MKQTIMEKDFGSQAYICTILQKEENSFEGKFHLAVKTEKEEKCFSKAKIMFVLNVSSATIDNCQLTY